MRPIPPLSQYKLDRYRVAAARPRERPCFKDASSTTPGRNPCSFATKSTTPDITFTTWPTRDDCVKKDEIDQVSKTRWLHVLVWPRLGPLVAAA